MNTLMIKQIMDKLGPTLNDPSSYKFTLLCDIKKNIQEVATTDFSEGDLISISRSEISEPIFSKVTKVGRTIYYSNPTDEYLYMISLAIATILKEYEWDFNHFSLPHLSYISNRVENYYYDLKILLNSHIAVMDAYCQSSKNWIFQNKQLLTDLDAEVKNWSLACKNRTLQQIYEMIENSARKRVVNIQHWDEFDVDGFSWTIGYLVFICMSANIISSFEDAFSTIYTSYINKGFLICERNDPEGYNYP